MTTSRSVGEIRADYDKIEEDFWERKFNENWTPQEALVRYNEAVAEIKEELEAAFKTYYTN